MASQWGTWWLNTTTLPHYDGIFAISSGWLGCSASSWLEGLWVSSWSILSWHSSHRGWHYSLIQSYNQRNMALLKAHAITSWAISWALDLMERLFIDERNILAEAFPTNGIWPYETMFEICADFPRPEVLWRPNKETCKQDIYIVDGNENHSRFGTTFWGLGTSFVLLDRDSG